MIIAQAKDINQIAEKLTDYERILVAGCAQLDAKEEPQNEHDHQARDLKQFRRDVPGGGRLIRRNGHTPSVRPVRP